MIPFIRNVRTGESTDRKQISDCQRLGEGNRELLLMGTGLLLGVMNVLELDGGDGCITL